MTISDQNFSQLGPAPSILPWSIGAWKRDLRITGFAGLALLSLQIAVVGQLEPSLVHRLHESQFSLFVFRLPFTLAAFLFLLLRPQFRRVTLRDFSGWFLIYTIYFLVSSIWSTEPMATLGKGIELLLGLGIVLHLSCTVDAIYRLDALRTLLLRFISMMGTIAVAGFLLRIPAFISHAHGIFLISTADAPFLSSNGLGYISSLLLLSVIADYLSKRMSGQRAMMQSGYAIFLFLFAESRTSIVIIILGIGILLTRKSWRFALGYIVSISLGVCIELKNVLRLFQGHQTQEQFDTLSGRTIMWAAAWRQWKTRPVFGFGGGAGGKFVISHLGIPNLQVLSSLHNGFLEALTGLGVIGFIVGLSVLIIATVSTCRRWRREPGTLGIYIPLIHIWVTSFMSIGVLGWMNYEVMLYLILLAVLDIQREGDRAACALSGEACKTREGVDPAKETGENTVRQYREGRLFRANWITAQSRTLRRCLWVIEAEFHNADSAVSNRPLSAFAFRDQARRRGNTAGRASSRSSTRAHFRYP
jgi:O-antigen ligase